MKSEKDIKRIFADKNAFRREVSLARVQIDGLSDDELAGVLAYELEPYCAIPAADQYVAWKEAESPDRAMRVFDVAVVRRGRDAASSAGAQKYVKVLSFAGVALLLALCCDYVHIRWRASSLEKSLSSRAPLQSEIDSLSKRASALRRQTQEIRSARESFVRTHRSCAELRGAYLGALDALSAVGGKAVVKKISKGAGDFSLEFAFAAADGKCGSDIMSALSKETAKRGWRLIPGDIVSLGEGLVEFDAAARYER